MNTNEHPRFRGTRVLWFSAAILALILVLQLGLPQASAARPDVATSGDFTMLTLPTSSEDLLLVLDGHNESLFVYRVRNKASFDLIVPKDLKSLFAIGKRIGSGTK